MTKNVTSRRLVKVQKKKLSLVDGSGERNRKGTFGGSADMDLEADVGQLVTLELRRRKHFRRKESERKGKHRNISGTCSGDLVTRPTLAGGDRISKAG